MHPGEKTGGVMYTSILLRISMTAAVLALAMTAVTLWLCRSGFLGLTGITRRKVV